MSSPAVTATPARQPLSSHARDVIGVALAALLYIAFHAAGGFPTLFDSGSDNDSVLRLVQVRDLLDGQGWFDLMQYRMGLKGGFAMHWSRLVDLPIAATVLVFETLTGSRSIAELAVQIVYPTALFMLALLAIVRAARVLGGEWAVLPATVIGALALLFVNLFRPGALDHHNIQLTLTLVTLLLMLTMRERPFGGALAGLTAAAMLAIGMETAPYVAAAGATAALCLLIGDGRDQIAARNFGLGFAGSSAVFFVATIAPSNWGSIQCDAFSLPQALLALIGGAGLASIAASSVLNASARRRLMALGGLSVVLACVSVGLFPACFADPYAGLDPRLQSYWIGEIAETQSFLTILLTDPATAVRFYVTPLIALCVIALLAQRRRGDRATLITAAFLAAAVLVSLWQIRGAPFAVVLATIPLAAWVGAMRQHADGRRNAFSQLGVAACWLLSMNIIWSIIAVPLANTATAATLTRPSSCYAYADYARLAALPVGTVVSVTNQGSTILRETPHRALIGPYHRNQAGALAALDILTADPADAERLTRQHKVDYVLLCPGNSETKDLIDLAPNGLLAQLAKGQVPQWLTLIPESQADVMQIYRVRPGA